MSASGIKHKPPVVDQDIHILRKRLINHLGLHNAKHRRSIFIQGYPGQGKSLFGTQYLFNTEKKFAWYQLTEEDRDPFILASGLAASIKNSFGENTTPAMDKIFALRDTSTPSPIFLSDAMLSDIKKNIIKDDAFYIALDDLQHLEKGEGAIVFLSSLINRIIPFLHFVFISRPCDRIVEMLEKSGRHPLKIDNRMLALTEDETASLMVLIRPDTIDPEMIDRIQKKADGWAMGTVLLGSTYNRGASYYSSENELILDPSVPSTVFDYFSCEVFPYYSAIFMKDLEKLSLLSEISIDFAATIVSAQTLDILNNSHNHPSLFLRSFGSEKTELEFHHLFRDALRKKATKDLDLETRHGVLFGASSWYLERNQYDKALFYRLEANDFKGAGEIMSMGAHFFFWERYAVYLRNIFDRLPEDMIVSNSWLCYFHGAILMEIESKRAMKYLTLAWRLFKNEENHHGEMLCLSKFVFFNASAGGRYWYGARVVKRLRAIYEKFGHTVSPSVKVLALNSISLGHTYFLAEYNEANKYSDMAAAILRKSGLHSLYYSCKLTYYASHAFAANWKDYVTEIEQIIDVFRRPDMSPYMKMVFGIGILNYLKLVGDFENFDPAADLFEDIFTRNLPRGKIPLLGFVDNWRIESAVTKGNFCKAKKILSQAFLAPYSAISIHTYGQLVHSKVFVASLTGEPLEDIEAYAEEAIKLRKKAGGPYFIWLCNLMIGAAYANKKSYEKAIVHLNFVIEETEKSGNQLLGVAGYANRAWVGIKTGGGVKSTEDLKTTISLMKNRDLIYFYTWTPHMMKDLFAEAVRLGIETDFVKKTAAEKTGLGFTTDKKPIPMLHIRIFGGFTILFKNQPVLDYDDIPNKSFDFIVSLASSKTLGLSFERMGDLLGHWDKDDRGQNAQQVMANRLRKRIKSAIPDIDPREYLRIDNQYHRLSNTFVDISEFRSLSDIASKTLENARPWHASTFYRRAFKLWKGSPFGGIAITPVLEAALAEIWKDIDKAALGWSKSLKSLSYVIPNDLKTLKEVLWALLHTPFIDETSTCCIETARNMHEIFKNSGMTKDAADMLRIIYPEMPQALKK